MIEDIQRDINWLGENAKSGNIGAISQVLNHLAVLTVTLGNEVSDAYKLQQELEDQYDIAFATKFTELTKGGISAAAAKPQVEAELAQERKDWTQAKAGYKRLSTFLDRCDRVLEAFRQSVSVEKMSNLKNI